MLLGALLKLTGWLEEDAAEMDLSLVVEGVAALTVKRGFGRKITGTGSSGSGRARCTKMGRSASGEEKEACGVKNETGLTGPRPRVQGERVRSRSANWGLGSGPNFTGNMINSLLSV